MRDATDIQNVAFLMFSDHLGQDIAQSFLNKETIGNDITSLHDIFVTHKRFLNKLHNLLVLLSLPDMESRIRSILKDANYIAKVIGIKGSVILKALHIYQDSITTICDPPPPPSPDGP